MKPSGHQTGRCFLMGPDCLESSEWPGFLGITVDLKSTSTSAECGHQSQVSPWGRWTLCVPVLALLGCSLQVLLPPSWPWGYLSAWQSKTLTFLLSFFPALKIDGTIINKVIKSCLGLCFFVCSDSYHHSCKYGSERSQSQATVVPSLPRPKCCPPKSQGRALLLMTE